MMNDETVYWQAGFTAGIARKRGDECLCRIKTQWARDAERLEKRKDRGIARMAFERGYREAARVEPTKGGQS